MSQAPLSDCRPWCELRAHDRVIRYRCSGAGKTLLALAPDRESPFWGAVVAGLDGRFRVITPEAPAEGTDLTAWLASLLEGLGTSVVRVVAADRFHAPALAIAGNDPDQVASLVLVTDAPNPVERVSATVLSVAATESAEAAGARVREFLTEGVPATA